MALLDPKCCLPVRHRTILPADLTLPESVAMPGGVRTFKKAVPLQFELPAGGRKNCALCGITALIKTPSSHIFLSFAAINRFNSAAMAAERTAGTQTPGFSTPPRFAF
jgi:hypothetical protein